MSADGRSEWPVVTIAEIQASKRWALNGGPFGSKLVSRDYVESGIPVIRGVNLPENRKFSADTFVFVSPQKADELLANNAHPGDVVFTQRGTLGQVGLIPHSTGFERFVISQSQMKLTVDESKADPEFVYYYFRLPSTVERIKNLGFSSGVPHINLDILRNFEMSLPPLPTQRKIASILSAYDELIENNTRRIAILEEMAQSLYREWFVHYRYPGHEHVPLVTSPLGPAPQGWEVRRLGDVVELMYGKALKASDRQEGSYPVYGSSGVVGHHNTYLVEGPGIVVGRKGNVGSVFLSADAFFPIDTAFYVRTGLPLLYVFYALREITFINSDVAVPGLNRSQAYLIPFLVPDGYLLSAFVEFVAPLLDEAGVLERKSANLRRTRDLLLPKLISDEVEPGNDSTPCEQELIHSGPGTHSDVVARSVAVGYPD